jgi:hypothetical protein
MPAPPMPGGGAPPGGAPGPGGPMGAAKPNIGPVTTPQGHPGNAAGALNDVRNAVRMLEQALPNIPMGSPLHSELLATTTKLAKHLTPGEGNQGLELQSLIQMARQMSQSQPMAALSRLQAPPGAPPAMPAAPPGGGEGGAPPMPMAA